MDPGGNLVVLDNNAHSAAWWNAVTTAASLVLAVCWVAALRGQALSYRRSSGEHRQQLKWLLTGSVVAFIGLVPTFLFPSSSAIAGYAATVGFAVIPLCIGLAVLKYRLFDIDRVLSRTLTYAIVTGLLIGVYAGIVLLATQVLSFRTPVAVAASTLVAAALFNPVRRRVQRLVNRRFNRARYDADRTVAAFAGRLQDAVDLDAVRGDLTGVVHKALEPSHISVWIRAGGRQLRRPPRLARNSSKPNSQDTTVASATPMPTRYNRFVPN